MDVLNNRLDFLERVIDITSEKDLNSAQGNCLDRLFKIESLVKKMYEQNPVLTNFLRKYQQNKDVLIEGSELDIEVKSMDIPIKAELVLSSEEYISEITANVIEMAGKIKELSGKTQKRTEDYTKLRAQITDAADKYHQDIEAMSSLFVQSDYILSKMEAKVTALEKTLLELDA
ncbi:hypothetical protein H4219_006283 [Mycoemilia scoparia]|uniref:Uncharacterized protein n=1 Tax=Mycoemilia scoparia TaxID=417184 RepID=A0A9W7ZKQ4_9FUNG|nr:hypothetical protein H4219_006283 [Mycoemilia scoparia]